MKQTIYSPVPLTWRDLPDALPQWVESLRSDRFWVMLLDNVKASARVRDAAMKAVVWLEMKSFSHEAQRPPATWPSATGARSFRANE